MSDAIKRKPGWWYPWIFVGAFAVVITVNGVMFYFARSTFSGIATSSPFEKGLQYNKYIAEEAKQQELGWQAETKLLPAGDKAVMLKVWFKDKAGAPLSGLTVDASFIRPVTQGHDQKVKMKPEGGGLYIANFAMPFKGLWEVVLVASDASNKFDYAERVEIK